VTDDQLKPRDLEPECKRTGVNLYQAFRTLVNANMPGTMRPIDDGEPVNLSVDLNMCHQILINLPDNAGTERFAEALLKLRRPKGPDVG
jgi:hypothetical protein